MAQKAVKHRLRFSHKLGKMVKVNPKRAAAAMKAARKRKGKKMSSATKAKISAGVKRAFKRKKNKFGHAVRKWGRPSTGRTKKVSTGKGKRGRPAGSKNAAKVEAPKRGRPRKEAAPAAKKRGRPRKEAAPAAKKRGRPAGSKNAAKASPAKSPIKVVKLNHKAEAPRKRGPRMG